MPSLTESSYVPSTVVAPVVAVEQIRRMKGGSQSHLMRCSDGNYYVVKFQNNPQHRRILFNEFLGTKLAERIGLPTTPIAIVEVSEDLIRLSEELVIELPRARIPCRQGLQFGSQFPGDPRRSALFDFFSDSHLGRVVNLADFIGMLVFDKWTCNADGRQVLFCPVEHRYRAVMIDQGFCFNVGGWNFPDAPLRGLYAQTLVYAGVIGMKTFEVWLERLEESITEEVFDEIIRQIPPDWYEDDQDELPRLIERLLARRSRIPELIVDAKESSRQPFQNWISDAAVADHL